MGGGIAQVCAAAGYSVILYDAVPDQVPKALAAIGKSLSRLAEKGSIERGAADDALGRIGVAPSVEAFSKADLVVEAIREDLDLKLELFKSLDTITPPSTILASNTSSIPITRLASATSRPASVIGMHFMNPVPIMRLVEVIRGYATSDETFEATRSVVKAVGKEVAVSQDYPGFIVNRILIPMINEAAYAVFEGLAGPEDIDKAMTLGTNQPMGPLALADFIGLDTVASIMEVLYAGFKDPKYRPCPLLTKMVQAGRLGKKSGEGFYDYPR